MSREREMPEDQEIAAASCFTGEVLQPTFDATNRIVTAQGTGLHDQPLDGVPVLFPYGFLAMPVQAVELTYLETASGLVVVSARDKLPAGIPVPAAGDSIQYSSGGSYAHHDADDDTVHEPKSGQVIKLGAGAAKPVALNKDPGVSNAVFDVWALAVEAGISSAGGTPPPTPWGATKAMSDITASATKVEAE